MLIRNNTRCTDLKIVILICIEMALMKLSGFHPSHNGRYRQVLIISRINLVASSDIRVKTYVWVQLLSSSYYFGRFDDL